MEGRPGLQEAKGEAMSDDLMDPGEPGDASAYLKAKDLVGHPCIFVPREVGEWPARDEERDEQGNVTQKAQGPQKYVECDVHKLDRAGVVESGTGVKVGWYRVLPQIEDKIGHFVAAMPVQDTATGNGKSIILTRLSDDMKKVARGVVEALRQEDPETAAF